MIKTISENYAEHMDKKVNKLLEEGWLLRGPVQVVVAVGNHGMITTKYTQQLEKPNVCIQKRWMKRLITL